MKLALRIEVATLRGTRDAVPRLITLLQEHRAGATFLFSLGPDRTGRAIGALPAVPRRRCYGLRALLSGTLLPAADIGARAGAAMRAVRDAGFEAGIQAHDRVAWLRLAVGADEAWTRAQMARACERFAVAVLHPGEALTARGRTAKPVPGRRRHVSIQLTEASAEHAGDEADRKHQQNGAREQDYLVGVQNESCSSVILCDYDVQKNECPPRTPPTNCCPDSGSPSPASR